MYEFDSNGLHLARYTRTGKSAADVFAVEVFDRGVSVGLANTAGVYYYLKDAQGSVTDVVNRAGQRVQHYSYSVFGHLLGIENAVGQQVLQKDEAGGDDVSLVPLRTAHTKFA